jgi:hypothetical protein
MHRLRRVTSLTLWVHRNPFLRRLGALTVNDCRARVCLAARLLAHHDVKRMMVALHRAVPIPPLEMQRLPLAADPQQVEKAVDNLAHVDIPRPPATSRRWDHRRHQSACADLEVVQQHDVQVSTLLSVGVIEAPESAGR